MQNKSHDHVKKPRAFSKGCTRSELTLTPIRRVLTKRRNKLVFRHSLKMISTGVVSMLYPQDMEHIGYNIKCDHYTRTLNASNKKRYWIIKSMYVGVKLLDQHRWTSDRDVTQWLQPLLWKTVGRSVSEKSDKMTWHSEWTPRLEKFLKKSILAFSSRNQTCEGVGSEEKEDAPEQRGFRDRVDLRFGAMTH